MKLLELQKSLRKKKVSHLVLTNEDPNFTYFTKLKGLSFSLLVVPQRGKPKLLVTALDKEKRCRFAEVVLMEKPWQKTLRRKVKPKRIAYNSLNLTLHSYKKLKKIFPGVRFFDFSLGLQGLRTEKLAEEIRYFKKAARLTDLAFEGIVKGLRKGKFKTENDVKRFLQMFAFRHETELSFPPIVASGRNSRNPHHQTSNKRLGKGFLLLDFGVSYKNYCSDMTRMVYLGEPTERERKLYDFLLYVQESILDDLKPDLKAGQVEKKSRDHLKEYSSYFIHGLGHGVGVEIHELPSFKPESEDVIKRGQVFTVEPGIYLKSFGMRIEDTVLMGEKAIRLTKSSKALVVIK